MLVALALAQGLSAAQIAAENTPEPFPPTTGLVDVRRADEHTLVLHWRDGYVIHHKIGQKRSAEQVVIDHPLDVAAACRTDAYTVTGPRGATRPDRIWRKTKGTDFAWFVDSWVDGHAVNNRPDYAAEHWIYVHVPTALEDGGRYSVRGPWGSRTVRFDPAGSLSDSLHVNLIGYRPDDPAKLGYLYCWEGDGGSMDVRPYVGRPFQVVDAESGSIALEGHVQFRRAWDNQETSHPTDTPHGNFLNADVADCDFSALTEPGRYFLRIPGIGRSRVFTIAADVYRLAFQTVMKGVLGQRSGIDLHPPFVPYTRPAPHNVELTPGFAGKLKYTRSRYLDRKNADYSPDDLPAVKAGIVGDLSVSGWYQDAGDWDSYESHIQVPATLMLAYQLAPKNYSAGELGLPDRPSALPDILKEAEWLPRFCFRLRHELLDRHYGTGGIGLRICGDHFGGDTGPKDVGRGSWQDVDRIWTASGEDPVSTFGYAGAAAQLAICLEQAGWKDEIDWEREAVDGFDWASTHTHPGDEKQDNYAQYRLYALCGLALLTGDNKYESALLTDTAGYSDATRLWFSDMDGPSLYLLGQGHKNSVLQERFRKAILSTADAEMDAASRRALRWGGTMDMPMLIGQQTTPWVSALCLASVLTRRSDPARSRAYFAAVETTADYFLGTNPLNMTWVSGLGPKFPRDPFSMDGWYESGVYPRPGIVPYGPWLSSHAQGVGPWDVDWANKSVYPAIDQWPGAERWFDNRCCPLTNEFTVHQNIAPSALVYGFLCGRK